MAMQRRARPRWPPSPKAGDENEEAPHLFAPHRRRQGYDAGKELLEFEHIDHVSDEMRAVIEDEWPELVHKLPPKRPQG
jgi:hypothetical protein